MTQRAMIATAVATSVVMLAGLLMVVAGIGGSYLLTLHAIHSQEAADAALKAHEYAAQVRAGLPMCKALRALDSAALSPRRLAEALHQVYAATRCNTLLSDFAHHEPISKIVQQLSP